MIYTWGRFSNEKIRRRLSAPKRPPIVFISRLTAWPQSSKSCRHERRRLSDERNGGRFRAESRRWIFSFENRPQV